MILCIDHARRSSPPVDESNRLDRTRKCHYNDHMGIIIPNWKGICAMRPPKNPRSSVRYPLDDLLGSQTLVRLLRVLVYEVAGPVSVTDAAKRAGLSRGGARKTLERLERLGAAIRIGTGRASEYGPKEGTPYLGPLRQLFELEQQKYEELIQQLRKALAISEVRDAWIENLPVEPGGALELSVVAETKAISWIGPELRTRLLETEKQLNFIVELAVFTSSDDPGIPKGAIILAGPGIVAKTRRPPGAQTHAESEERSFRMAQVIAEMIRADPSLLGRALRYTNRLLHEGQGMASSDIGEWRQLLETYSPKQLRDLLVARSSRADRLRRSSPFFAVLTPEERDLMMREFDQADR